ncbi:MAG: molybdenum cofactor guanylyltransferase [Myxococcota bacterium]
MDTSGIVLCGGRSTRMGRPKALLPWGGATLVEAVVRSLLEAVDRVVVVHSGAFELPRLPVPVVLDREPGLGPLAGIREGLHALPGGLAFVASTDAPFLSPGFVGSMLGFGGAAALEQDGFVQTLCAVYDAGRASAADALLESGARRPLALLEASGYRRVAPAEVEDADSIRGFNRPEEYLAAVRDRQPGARSTLEFLGRARRAMGRECMDVPVGRLGEVLGHAEPALRVCADGAVAKPFLVSLNGRDFVRDPALPVGPGDRVFVMDSAVGG